MYWVFPRNACGSTIMPAESAATLLIQFAREPVAGQVKTRMIPALGEDEACELHCELVRWTTHCLLASGIGSVRLAVTGDTQHPLFLDCLASGVDDVLPQQGADLGERMFTAIRDALESYQRVILVGSDCPGLDAGYLEQAVTALDTSPLVLGPAQDGGYVLIGARHISQALFKGVEWGTDQVFQQTVARLAGLGWDWRELPLRSDIDRPEDLPQWHALARQNA